MSETLKKLGINLEYFPRDMENEAVEQLTCLRMEHILQGENLKFNWNNLLQRPELIELNTEKGRNSQFQQELVFDGEEDQEWIYAQTSLFIFSQKSIFRKNIIAVLKQKHFDYLRLLFAILNMVAYSIFDYHFRVDGHYPNINRVSVGIEVICNFFFGFEMALQIIAQGLLLEKGTYLRNGWNLVNFIAFLTGWSVLYDNSSKQEFLKFCRATRLLRCGRIIYDIPVLRNQMNAFVGSFPKLGAIIIPLLFVMFFYAIVGLHVFQGVTEYRCRETPLPDFEKNEWVSAEIDNLCGIWTCPEGTYCGNPADYDIPRNYNEGISEIFNFGYARFDDVFYSILVILTYLNVTGWSGTVFFYWKAVSTYLTGFFFVTLIFFLSYVLSNLLLATFYESFMVQSSIKQNKKAKQEEEQLENEIQKKRQQQMVERLAVMGETQIIGSKSRLQTKVSMYFNQDELQNTEERERGALKRSQKLSVQISKSIYFIMCNCLFIALDTIALCMDYHGISYNDWKTLQIIDFICMIYFFVELSINIWGKGFKLYLKKHINLFDTLVISSQIALCFYCFIQRLPIIVNTDVNIQLWKSIKILKILKLLYSAKIFHTISVLIRCLVETCYKIKFMICLFLTLGLIVATFGRELFGQKIKFIGEADRFYDPKGESPKINYDSLGSALTAAINIFYNEEWHVSMFEFTKVEEISSLMFYLIAILLLQVFFVRLLMAVFLNEFCQCLNRVDQQLKPFHQNKQFQDIFMTITQIFTKKKINSQGLDNSDKKENNKLIESSSPKQIQDEQIEFPVKKQSLLNKFNSTERNPDNIFQKINQDDNDNIIFQKNEIKSPENENDILNSEQEKSPPIVFDQKDVAKSQRLKKEQSNLQSKLLPIVDSLFMKSFVFLLNIGTGIRVALVNPLEDPHSYESKIIETLFILLTTLYALITIIDIMARGFYSGDDSFIKHNPVNLLLFLISVFEIITLIFSIEHPLAGLINSLRLTQFIQVASEFNSDIRYAIVSLINSFRKMIQLVLFCFFVLLAYGLFPMKLLKGQLYYCTALDESISLEKIGNKLDCFDYGGCWVNQILNYDNIFQSVLLLFVTTTTENWLPLLKYTWSANGIDQQPREYNNLWWSAYFQIYFFIGFVLMLNMFIGLIVNTYEESKLKASNLHLLDDTQREFFLIKRQIYLMKPLVKGYEPANKLRLFLFKIIKSKIFKWASILVIIFNIFILCLYYHRQDKKFRDSLDIINTICVGIFGIEILIRFIARGFESYFKDFSNSTDLVLYWFCIANLIIRNDETVDFQARKYLQAIGVAYQLLRGYRIIKRFNPIEKLFQSIFSVIPSAFAMLVIMFIFMFIYTSLGMDMFAYLRPQSDGVNGFDMHFKKFTAGMFTLIKVASAEQWWNVLINCVKTKRPDFHCIEITTYEEFLQFGYNGCGTVYAYIYYIFFHLVFSLMLLNVFIASVLGAYAEHVKSAESAISKYQLNDVIRLWSSYDRKGVGFIDYKFFWKLSSEIAIIFGVNQSDLLDQNNKKNFLKVLNIPIFENTADNKLCYKFHDVIQSLTKISVTLKYGVSNLEPTDPEIIEKLDSQLHKHDYGKVSFRATPFSSGDMSSIIWIQKKVRMLRKRLKGEKIGEIGDLNKVIKENK